MTTSNPRRMPLPDKAVHRLLNLFERSGDEHRTNKAAQIDQARLEEACQMAAYVTGHSNPVTVWLALEAAVDEIGGQLNGQAHGTAARDERLAALIAVFNARLTGGFDA